MVFSSTLFLFLFLPVVITGYYLSPGIRMRNIFLLFASLFFYAWGENFYLLLMLASIALNYLCGILIEHCRADRAAKRILAVGIISNLALLGAFKYTNFITDTLNQLLLPLGLSPLSIGPVHLPIGISFFTFQAISYIIDVYRREAPIQHNPLDCGLYIALFPQLIAGPIVRYHDIAKQLLHRSHTSARFYNGILLFIVGLGKKMLLANPMGAVADSIFGIPAGEVTPLLAWSGAFAYSLQIYFDFSGYSDMAIGLGRLFGFELLINFHYPYIASSFRDFWQRWHISLSSWFRDYLYIPLGGSRCGTVRTGINLFLVFSLCGLWHGASWNFILWGLVHGTFLVLERGILGTILNKCWRPFRHLYLLIGIMVTWVLFRADNLPASLQFLKAMAGIADSAPLLHPMELYWTKHKLLVCFTGILAATPLFYRLHKYLYSEYAHLRTGRIALYSIQISCSALIFWLCAMELAAGTHNPFIYFRF